jgi:hypothetical protein
MAHDGFQGGEPNRRILPPRRQVHGEEEESFREKFLENLVSLCELGVLAVKIFN